MGGNNGTTRGRGLSQRTALGVQELLALIRSGHAPPIVDVRTSAEYAGGHVPGARNVPLASIWSRAAALPEPGDEPMVVYCGHGPRARIAAALLRYRGFRIVLLTGHMAAWRRAGLTEERG
jgi:rhodanese-related sulfurtransferase